MSNLGHFEEEKRTNNWRAEILIIENKDEIKEADMSQDVKVIVFYSVLVDVGKIGFEYFFS